MTYHDHPQLDVKPWQSQYWSNVRSRSCQALPAVNSFAQTRGPVLTTCANKAQPCPRSRSPWSSGSKRRVVHSVSKTSLSSGPYQFNIGLQCIWFDGDYSMVHQRTGAAWSPIDHWCGFVVKVNMQMPWNAYYLIVSLGFLPFKLNITLILFHCSLCISCPLSKNCECKTRPSRAFDQQL
jgi:hypothetical protein